MREDVSLCRFVRAEGKNTFQKLTLCAAILSAMTFAIGCDDASDDSSCGDREVMKDGVCVCDNAMLAYGEPGKCELCKEANRVIVYNKCVCDEGFAENADHICEQMQPSINECGEHEVFGDGVCMCNNASNYYGARGNCQLCDMEHKHVVNNACVCEDNYMENGDGVCLPLENPSISCNAHEVPGGNDACVCDNASNYYGERGNCQLCEGDHKVLKDNACVCDEPEYVSDGGDGCTLNEKDDNRNYMFDRYETASDQGEDCQKDKTLTYNKYECVDFCDSFIGYKCSTKCTSDDQCISDAYFCRSDGRCVPKVFETQWKVEAGAELRFPGGNGEGCNYTIDWGDGSTTESFTDCADYRAHTYAEAGDKIIKVTGTIVGWRCAFDTDYCWRTYRDNSFCMTKERRQNNATGAYLTEVHSFGPVGLGVGAFECADALLRVYPDDEDYHSGDIPNSDMTSMKNMFYDTSKFNQSINHWDVSHVTDMTATFGEATAFKQDLDHWDTSKVKIMDSMFNYANRFKGKINRWNTSNVTSMNYMFYMCHYALLEVDQWDVSNVTSMISMFENANSFNQSLENWNVHKLYEAADLDGPVDKFPWYNMLSAETSGIGLSTENWRKMVENNADWAAINEKGGVGMPKL